MPQLKKVVLGMGNLLVYTDTYEQALAQLSAAMQGLAPSTPSVTAPGAAQPPTTVTVAPPNLDQRLESIRNHLRRYRDLAGQGRWAEAGKELEAIESEAAKK